MGKVTNQKNFTVLHEDINNACWDKARFNLSRKPIIINKLNTKKMSRPTVNNITDMVVKLPNFDPAYPQFLTEEIISFINDVIKADKQINKRFNECYMYLSVWNAYLNSGDKPLCMADDMDTCNLGPHVDGIQGSNYPVKLPACHTYTVVEAVGATYYTHPFNAGYLNEETDNIHLELAQQKNESQTFSPIAGEIILYSAYQVHSMPVIGANGTRMVYRIDVSFKEFNRLGCSFNPAISGFRPVQNTRRIPRHLRADAYVLKNKSKRKVCHSCGEQLILKSCTYCLNLDKCIKDLSKAAPNLIDALKVNLWCLERRPVLDYEDFVFVSCIPNFLYMAPSKMLITFYSKVNNCKFTTELDVKMIDSLKNTGFKGRLKFKLLKKTHTEAQSNSMSLISSSPTTGFLIPVKPTDGILN